MFNFNFLADFFLGSVILQKLSTTPCSDRCNFRFSWHTNVNKMTHERAKLHTCPKLFCAKYLSNV